MSLITRIRHRGPAVVVVVPAVSVRSTPRVFTSTRGGPGVPMDGSSREAKAAIGDEIAKTYRIIESRTAVKAGDRTYTSWRERGRTVLQFTIPATDSRQHVLLARTATRSLQGNELAQTQAAILACAETADLPLQAEHVAAALQLLSSTISNQRSNWRQ